MTTPSPTNGQALDWWVDLITRAEAETGNEKARLNPFRYMAEMRTKLSAQPEVVSGIEEEYRKAASAGTLNEPLWSKTVQKQRNGRTI